MIDYNLAKQLKDAGYPQEIGLYFLLNPKDSDKKYRQLRIEEPKGYENLLIAGYDLIFIPTLSELISELGEKFSFLAKVQGSEIPLWKASLPGELFSCIDETPEGAVALLWLELNKCEACENKDSRMHTCTKFR